MDYCDEAGQNLMQGWGKRRNEWQFGLGVQHELLPRLSAEVTYNRRKYGNLTDTDTVNQGCDYYGERSAQCPGRGLRRGLARTTPTRPGCATSTASSAPVDSGCRTAAVT